MYLKSIRVHYCHWCRTIMPHSNLMRLSHNDILTLVSDPPSIINISPNITVNENGSVTLNCTADGNPQSNITWTNVSGDKVSSSFRISGKENEGYYRCTAQNGIGNPAAKEVFIFVECKLGWYRT